MSAAQSRRGGNRRSVRPRPWVADTLASVVVFLVALPLCIGIAVACGVPPERGLVTGIVGGLVVGVFSGAPLLVSGPAASLIVPVFDLVRTHGLVALAPVVMLAGVWQAIAGMLRLGQWFRAVAPAVIHGMLIGIGILIFASQLHVAIDADPQASFVDNIATFPGALAEQVRRGGSGLAPVLIALATIGLLAGWNRWRPRRLKLVPGALVAVVVVIVAALVLDAPVKFLDVSPDFFAGLAPVTMADFERLRQPSLIGLSLVFAFVASAATLLTANAIDQRQTHSQTDYDREMVAQGVGNLLTGSVGGLPMTGVIVRSSVNVDSGARTRLSTILHGVWILAFVSFVPEVLERIPQASLGAILVYTGYRLIDVRALRGLYQQGRAELAIALITLFGVVFVELFVGIVAGLAAAFGKLVYTFSHLEIRSEPSPSKKVQHLHLTGSATFVQLPRLARALDAVPADRELHVHIDRLDHIDHACLELLSSWRRRRASEDAPGMVVKWDELTERYRKAVVGVGARPSEPSRSLLSLVWDEWKRIYAPRRQARPEPLARDWIDASRIRVQVEAADVRDVLVMAAQALAPVAPRSARELETALLDRIEGHVALGVGVSIPHVAIDDLDRSVGALVVTRNPIDVAGEQADIFFVLLAPQSDPEQHLRSLAHVGRLCHDLALLDDLRGAATPDEAATLLDTANRSLVTADSWAEADTRRMLAVIAAEGEARANRIAERVRQAFARPAMLSRDDGGPFEVLHRVLAIPVSRRILLLPLQRREVEVLRALLAEQARLFPEDECVLHLLSHEE